MAFLVRDGDVDFLSTVGEGEDVCWFVDAALQLTVVAVRTRVGVFGVDARSVAAFAVGAVGTVGAVDGIEKGVKTPGICIIWPCLIVDVVYIPYCNGLGIDCFNQLITAFAWINNYAVLPMG